MMGIAGGVVAACMQGLIPLVMISLISNVGWRTTYILIGFACICVMSPMGAVFFRHAPERYGQLPDAIAVDTTVEIDVADLPKENVHVQSSQRQPQQPPPQRQSPPQRQRRTGCDRQRAGTAKQRRNR